MTALLRFRTMSESLYLVYLWHLRSFFRLFATTEREKENNIKLQSNMKHFYYILVNGVRLRVTAETLRQYNEEERLERIKKMNRQDQERRNEYIQKYKSNERDSNR